MLVPDVTFGSNGVMVFEDPSPTWLVDYPNAMSIGADGSIIVGGAFSDGCCPQNGLYALRAKRFTSAGNWDPGFSLDPTPFSQLVPLEPNEFTDVRDLAYTADGKLLLLVERALFSSASNRSFFLIRTLPDGSLDPSYDSDGRWLQPQDFDPLLPDTITYADSLLPVFPRIHLNYNCMAVQPDGKVIVAADLFLGYGLAGGSYGAHATVVFRFLPDGGYDTSFAGQGWTYLPYFNNTTMEVWGVVVRPDGKILVGTSFGEESISDPALRQHHVWRLEPDGSNDPGYGVDGLATLPLTGSDLEPWFDVLINGQHMLLLDDGGTLIGGTLYDGPDDDLGVFKLNDQGQLDSDFAQNGLLRIGMGPGNQEKLGGLARLPDGRYLVSGSSNDQAAFACFDQDGEPCPGFGVNGQQTMSGTHAGAVRLRPDGRILVGTYDLGSGSIQMRLEQYVSNGPNGTGEVEPSGRLNIHPSPADDRAELRTDRPVQSIMITDAIGRQVFHQRVMNLQRIHLDTRALRNGIYHVHVRGPDHAQQTTMVIAHP